MELTNEVNLLALKLGAIYINKKQDIMSEANDKLLLYE